MIDSLLAGRGVLCTSIPVNEGIDCTLGQFCILLHPLITYYDLLHPTTYKNHELFISQLRRQEQAWARFHC